MLLLMNLSLPLFVCSSSPHPLAPQYYFSFARYFSMSIFASLCCRSCPFLNFHHFHLREQVPQPCSSYLFLFYEYFRLHKPCLLDVHSVPKAPWSCCKGVAAQLATTDSGDQDFKAEPIYSLICAYKRAQRLSKTFFLAGTSARPKKFITSMAMRILLLRPISIHSTSQSSTIKPILPSFQAAFAGSYQPASPASSLKSCLQSLSNSSSLQPVSRLLSYFNSQVSWAPTTQSLNYSLPKPCRFPTTMYIPLV